jgi:phosphate transport system ATP-binding protein
MSDNGQSILSSAVMEARHVTVRSPTRNILTDVSLDIPDKQVTAIIGPSGCGKTTFVRTLNRMIETTPQLKVEGAILYRGQNIYDRSVNPVIVRQRIGMVFQRPVVFPMSIYENVAFGLRLNREDEDTVERTVRHSIERAALSKEFADDLDQPALNLSGGQQQRVCIARALAVNPSVLLLDEPTSSLDPMATRTIEATLRGLASQIAVVLVTHNIAQAARVSQETAFMYEGRLVEAGPTQALFERPKDPLTDEYLTGRIG